MNEPTVFLAADHRGFSLKAHFIAWLSGQGYTIKDLGTDTKERCDAMDFAKKMARDMGDNADVVGVLICGSGQAMAMTANRYKNLRAALCYNATVARLSREHNDANVLVLGADVIGPAVAMECLEVFLKSAFLGGHYAARRDKFMALGGL